jgi:hypothetical protein
VYIVRTTTFGQFHIEGWRGICIDISDAGIIVRTSTCSISAHAGVGYCREVIEVTIWNLHRRIEMLLHDGQISISGKVVFANPMHSQRSRTRSLPAGHQPVIYQEIP